MLKNELLDDDAAEIFEEKFMADNENDEVEAQSEVEENLE